MRLYTSITGFFLIWFIGVFILFIWGFNNISHFQEIPFFTRALANWDGGHFIGIAQKGYKFSFQYAFFPLYPLLIRFFSLVFKNYYLSAFLISLVSVFLGIKNFYKLLLLDFSEKVSKKAVLFFLIFPTSFFLLTAYSESLYFLLSMGAFLGLRSFLEDKVGARKNIYLVLALICAFLASLTRLVGIALIISLLVEGYQYFGFRWRWLVLFIPFLGFLIYCLYLYYKTGSPIYFLMAEEHWQRSLSVPGLNFWQSIQSLVSTKILSNYWVNLSDLVFSVFGLGLILRSIRFLRPSYVVYGICSIIFPLVTPSLSSMPRFLLPIFPIFIVLAKVEDKRLIRVYSLLSVALLAVFSVSYISGYWVS